MTAALVVLGVVVLVAAGGLLYAAHRAPVEPADVSQLDLMAGRGWSVLEDTTAILGSTLERFPVDVWSDDPDRITRRGYTDY